MCDVDIAQVAGRHSDQWSVLVSVGTGGGGRGGATSLSPSPSHSQRLAPLLLSFSQEFDTCFSLSLLSFNRTFGVLKDRMLDLFCYEIVLRTPPLFGFPKLWLTLYSTGYLDGVLKHELKLVLTHVHHPVVKTKTDLLRGAWGQL